MSGQFYKYRPTSCQFYKYRPTSRALSSQFYKFIPTDERLFVVLDLCVAEGENVDGLPGTEPALAHHALTDGHEGRGE